MLRRWGFLFLLFWTATSGAQVSRPVAVLSRLQFRLDGSLPHKVEESLISEFDRAFHDKSGALMISSDRRDGAMRKGVDYASSDTVLADLARDVDALYSVHAFVVIASGGRGKDGAIQYVLRLRARVVQSDGSFVKEKEGTATFTKKGIRPALVEATQKLIDALDLGGLPAVPPAKESIASAAPAESSLGSVAKVADDRALVLPLPPPPPPLVEVKKSESAVLRPVGYAALAVGGAVLVAGVIVFALAPKVHQDAFGSVLSQDASFALSAQRQQVAGVTLMIAGGVLAAAGGVTALVFGSNTIVRAAFVPSVGGGALVLGGTFR